MIYNFEKFIIQFNGSIIVAGMLGVPSRIISITKHLNSDDIKYISKMLF